MYAHIPKVWAEELEWLVRCGCHIRPLPLITVSSFDDVTAQLANHTPLFGQVSLDMVLEIACLVKSVKSGK